MENNILLPFFPLNIFLMMLKCKNGLVKLNADLGSLERRVLFSRILNISLHSQIEARNFGSRL